MKTTPYRMTRTIVLIIAMLLIMVACGPRNENPSDERQQGSNPTEDQQDSSQTDKPDGSNSNEGQAEPDTSGDNPIVTIEMDNGDIIKLELYPKVAPNTVNNFISLVNKGVYDGTIFHRVMSDFMIQGGDPDGNGTGGPGYAIKGEFTKNGFENLLKHTKGVISMARSRSMDSAGSQFFITVEDSFHLDELYAAFGRVIEGQDVADEISKLPTGAQDRPKTPPVMKKVTVDTRGVDYPEPEIVE